MLEPFTIAQLATVVALDPNSLGRPWPPTLRESLSARGGADVVGMSLAFCPPPSLPCGDFV